MIFMMRADNRGEGGIFALLALVPSAARLMSPHARRVVVFSALLGASLLYGDGFITPAVSVLSAVAGLEVATSAAQSYIAPITCAMLSLRFLVQRQGTTGIGNVFGPIMIVWFALIFPALILNYFRQGALLLVRPAGLSNLAFKSRLNFTKKALLSFFVCVIWHNTTEKMRNVGTYRVLRADSDG